MHMHTPPKSFHPSVDKTHTTGKEAKQGVYVKKEIGTQNTTKKIWRNIHYKDHRKETKRWWYIDSRIRPPPKKPIIPTTYTLCYIKKEKGHKKTKGKPCNIICKIDVSTYNKKDAEQMKKNEGKGNKPERACQKIWTEMVTTPTLCRDCKHTIKHNS